MSGFLGEYDVMHRRALDAATRLRWAARRIDSFRRSGPTGTLASIEARALLATVIDSAEILVYCLDDDVDDYELVELERSAGDVRSALRRRRLAAKLAETAGRTPEEAAAFAAKAEELTS